MKRNTDEALLLHVVAFGKRSQIRLDRLLLTDNPRRSEESNGPGKRSDYSDTAVHAPLLGRHPMPPGSARNPLTAARPSQTNKASTTSCVTRNGGSCCFGAATIRAGSRRNGCTSKTKTFRESASTVPPTEI